MSIASEITRIQTAKSDLATSIANKGVTVPASATLDDYAALVDSIQTGGGGSTLPYDAEVEYIESTGTQWIDTGINLRQKVVMSANVSITKSITTNSIIFGASYDNSTVPKFQIGINSSNKWLSANTSYYSYYEITGGGTVSLNTKYTPIVAAKATQASDATIYIFARNNDGGSMLPIDGLRLYGAYITSGGLVVRDFIPVRIGTVGYLYDRVSGSLFGNSGTGSFTLGSDV